MKLNHIKKKLEEIKALRFVKTHRHGNTGVGKTLEDLLEIKENNIPLPDIKGKAELKAYRRGATSMLTLFTFEPQPRGSGRDRTLLDHFGYSRNQEGRPKELYSTLSCKRYNNQGLKINLTNDRVNIVGQGKHLGIYWTWDDLKLKFEEKLPALIYVLADAKEIEGIEHFHFNEAYFLKGFSFDHFKKMLQDDDIVADLRMYYRPDRTVRNHGTGFRLKIKKLFNCFKEKLRIT